MKKIPVILLAVMYITLSCTCCESEEKKMQTKYNISPHFEVVKEISGLSKDFEIVFISDSHISLADERDTAEVEDKALSRFAMFKDSKGNDANKTFNDMIEYTKYLSPDLLILGGDITDSAMLASIEAVEQNVKKLPFPYIYSLGNHDFEYGKEYFSQESYTKYLPRFKDISKSDKGYQIKDMGELVIFAVNDDNNKFSSDALEAFRSVCSGSKPVILVTHVPIEPQTNDTSLWDKTIDVWRADSNGNSRVLLGDKSCIPDDATREFINLALSKSSPVVLVLAGHIHFYHRDMLNDKIVQITSGAGYEREMVHVTLTASNT